jgi:hypothetical protein
MSTSKNAYVFSSTKLEIRAEQVMPGSKGSWGVEGGGRVYWGEMAQTMYAYVNKLIKIFKIQEIFCRQ